jgi:hypothetical protein
MRFFPAGILGSLLLTALPGHQPLRAQGASAIQWGTAVKDSTVVLERVTYLSGQDTVPAILARPARPGTYPAIIVLHANWLVEPYIGETAAALAWQRTVTFLKRHLPSRPTARELAPRRNDSPVGSLDPGAEARLHGAH